MDPRIYYTPERNFIILIEQGDLEAVKNALAQHPEFLHSTRQSALHMAVALNDLPMARLLVEMGSPFGVDGQGRRPTAIAIECEVDQALHDYIVDAEESSTSQMRGFGTNSDVKFNDKADFRNAAIEAHTDKPIS